MIRMLRQRASRLAAPLSRRPVAPMATSAAQAQLPVLVGMAQWSVASSKEEPETLRKVFDFTSASDADRFHKQVMDLSDRVGPCKVAASRPDGTSEVLVLVLGSSGSDDVSEALATQLNSRDVAVASAVDDLGAAIQLQGKWS